jgi:hypothetical protein
VACEECGARLESSESGASSGATWNARDPDTRAEGINAGLALVSEWLDAAGVPRGPKGHGAAETVQARIAGLAGSPPTAPAAPGKADRPTPVARLLARAAEYDAMPDRLQRGEGNRGRDKWRAKAAAFREAAGMLIDQADRPDQARAALRAALRRLREGPPHAGAGDPDAWVRELRDDAPATGDDDLAAWREWGAQSIDPEAIERLAEEGRDPGDKP